MYKDGFELKDGNYYWARWVNIVDDVFIVRYVEFMWRQFFDICGSDVAIRDYEIVLLKEVKYD